MLGKVLVAPQGAYKKCIFPDAAKPLIPHRKWVFKDVLERWPSSAFLRNFLVWRDNSLCHQFWGNKTMRNRFLT